MCARAASGLAQRNFDEIWTDHVVECHNVVLNKSELERADIELLEILGLEPGQCVDNRRVCRLRFRLKLNVEAQAHSVRIDLTRTEPIPEALDLGDGADLVGETPGQRRRVNLPGNGHRASSGRMVARLYDLCTRIVRRVGVSWRLRQETPGAASTSGRRAGRAVQAPGSP